MFLTKDDQGRINCLTIIHVKNRTCHITLFALWSLLEGKLYSVLCPLCILKLEHVIQKIAITFCAGMAMSLRINGSCCIPHVSTWKLGNYSIKHVGNNGYNYH